MMKIQASWVLLFFAVSASAQNTVAPTIKIHKELLGQLELGPDVSEALKKFNAKFKLYDLKDFDVELLNSYVAPPDEKSSASCEERNPPAVKALPMAVIGDFNGDGRDDAVVLGHDSQHRVLAVLSGTSGYSVSEIEKKPYVPSKKLVEALTLVESTAKARAIDFYVKCLPPTVKRFKADAVLVGEYMTDNNRLYFLDGKSFKQFRPN